MGISSLRALFEHGGPVMWPLLAASVLALAVIIDRALVFIWEYQRFGPVVGGLRPLITRHSWAEAERWCGRRGPLTSLARVYLEQRNQPREVRDDVLRREGSLLLAHLEKRLRLLAVLAQISTLLGLLGTFYFMIYRFHPDATAGGQLQQADFFLAIWESFLSTMFGLMIAVPCTAAYHLFEGRADTVAREMSTLVSYLDEWARTPAERPRVVSPARDDGPASDNARHSRKAP
jgi:biopolymer transport protein ExbB